MKKVIIKNMQEMMEVVVKINEINEIQKVPLGITLKQLHNVELNQVQYDIAIASILGDGNLNFGARGGASLHFGHGVAQAKYLMHKQYHFNNISMPARLPSYTEETKSVLISTCKNADLAKSAAPFYNAEGKKIIPKNIIDYFTPRMLAYWYMDDGTFAGRKESIEFKMNTHNFSKEDIEQLKMAFQEKYGLNPAIYQNKTSKITNEPLYILRFNTKDGPKFQKIIEPYIIEDMRYKLAIGAKQINTQRKLDFNFENFVKQIPDERAKFLKIFPEYCGEPPDNSIGKIDTKLCNVNKDCGILENKIEALNINYSNNNDEKTT